MKKVFLFLFFMSMMQVAMSCSDDDEMSEEPFYTIKLGSDSISVNDSTNGVERENEILVSLFASNGRSHQSAAAYGEYAFFVTDRRASLFCYNLKSKKLVCEKKFTPENEMVGKYVLYHCNQMTFGLDFYDKDDPFPLLYISQRARDDERCFVEVYRLIPTGKGLETDYTSLDAELKQTIFFPAQTNSNDLGRANCVIDVSNGLMYTYSYNTKSSSSNRYCRISCFNIPDMRQKDVVLDEEDIIDSFSVDYNATNSQGGCIKGGVLYIGQGYQSIGYIYLNVIDLNTKKLIDRVDLFKNGFFWEPEGAFVYDDSIMLSTGSSIWKFVFY